MPESVRLAMCKGNWQEPKERRAEDSFELLAGARAHSAPAPAGWLEIKFQPQLHNAGASRSEDRVAIDDVRRAAPATERMGNRGIVADIGANHAAVWILERCGKAVGAYCKQ